MKKYDIPGSSPLFDYHEHDESGIYSFKPIDEIPPLPKKTSETKTFHADRIKPIKTALNYANAYNKSERTRNLQDWQIRRKGLNIAEINEHLIENWDNMVASLGEAALCCKWHDDGSCIINCNPGNWYKAHAAKGARKDLDKSIYIAETRCGQASAESEADS